MGSHKSSQEGPWLLKGWKSNVNQQEVRVEFIEDIENMQIQVEPLGAWKGKVHESHLCLGSGFVIEVSG